MTDPLENLTPEIGAPTTPPGSTPIHPPSLMLTLTPAPPQKPVEGEPAEQKFVRDVVYYLVIILFIGFATTFLAAGTLLWQAWTQKAATYQDLVNQVNSENQKIDNLTQQLQKK